MNSDRADQPATPENPQQRATPGQALAAQREALGWSVEQVAEQLKMAVRQVVALEAGDYSALPSPAVTRGFVRAYAKILRLDPAPLVAMIEMDTPAPAEAVNRARSLDKPARFNESSRFPLHGKRSSLPLGWIGAGVVVAVAAAAAWHFGLIPHHQAEPAAAGTPVAAPASAPHGTTEEPLHNPDVPLISVPGQQEQQPQNNAQPPANGAAAPATPPANGAPGAAAAPAAAQPAAAPAPVQAAVETAVPANGLVLKVNEDSWIQVRTADGKNLISRLVKAGDTQSLPVEQPVTLTVGNPKGVNASLRGAAVELPLLPGKTIARVALK